MTTLRKIFEKFILKENDKFVKDNMLSQIEPLLISQLADENLVYDDFDDASPMFLAAKLQSSIAAYLVIAFKHFPDAVKAVFLGKCLHHQPVLMYLIHWTSVFLNEKQAQELMGFIIKNKVSGIFLTKEVQPLIDGIVLNDDSKPLISQLRTILYTYNSLNALSSIGIHSKVNWERLERDSSWGGVSMPSSFKRLTHVAAKDELVKLNIIAYINAMPFASIHGIEADWLGARLVEKMPKGLMPPTVLYKASLTQQRHSDESFDTLYQTLITEMFTHGGIKKIPGVTHIGIDWSGSMDDRINTFGNMERKHAAILMAYMLSLVCEKSEIWLSGDSSRDKGLHVKLTTDEKELLFSNIFTKRNAQTIARTHGLSGGGIFEYDFFATLKKDIDENPDTLPVNNVFLFCDGADCDTRLQESYRGKQTNVIGDSDFPLINICDNQFVMNVQHDYENIGVAQEAMFTRIYGHSDYLLEWLCLMNKISNPMEKSDSTCNTSFRNQ